MINGNSAVLAWTNVGGDPNNNNSATLRGVSNWLPSENIPQNYSVPKNFPNRNPDNDAFTNSIIRVFAGEPKRVAPPIQNQKSGQSMLDFFGRGLNAQGPATHSNQAPNHPQQSVGRHGNFLEFLGNPLGNQAPQSNLIDIPQSLIKVKVDINMFKF